jgi:hypothetical protein
VGPVAGPVAARVAGLSTDGPQRSNNAALSASRSPSPITVAPELTGRGTSLPRWRRGRTAGRSRSPAQVDLEPLQERSVTARPLPGPRYRGRRLARRPGRRWPPGDEGGERPEHQQTRRHKPKSSAPAHGRIPPSSMATARATGPGQPPASPAGVRPHPGSRRDQRHVPAGRHRRGIAVWGAILVGRGADKAAELLAGTPAAGGPRPRELVEAASSGSLVHALAAVPPQARQVLADAAGAGFLAGLNAVLTLAALLSLAGAILALLLVRQHEILRGTQRAASGQRRGRTSDNATALGGPDRERTPRGTRRRSGVGEEVTSDG